MNRLIGWGLCALVLVTVGLWWNRVQRSTELALGIRRVSPAEGILRGSPNSPVQVELELTNHSSFVMDLNPVKMPCSCQITSAPSQSIPAGGSTRAVLSFRYPQSKQSLVPVEFTSPSGQLLARTEVVLEADLQLPYFVYCPTVVEMQIVDGVSDHAWSTTALAVEESGKPLVKGVRMIVGADAMKVSCKSTLDAQPGATEGQRTYQLEFEMQDSLANNTAWPQPLQGLVHLELSDGSVRPLPWIVIRKPPLALVYDVACSHVRAVRRAGARGVVTFRVHPEGSGVISPDQFTEGQAVSAMLTSSSMKPDRIEAIYQGNTGMVSTFVEIP